jgi:hypothetical protein
VESIKSAKTISNSQKAARLAKSAKAANTIRKGSKAAKITKITAAGTRVGAMVSVGASLAGVDPVEYNRRMTALKKNPANTWATRQSASLLFVLLMI